MNRAAQVFEAPQRYAVDIMVYGVPSPFEVVALNPLQATARATDHIAAKVPIAQPKNARPKS